MNQDQKHQTLSLFSDDHQDSAETTTPSQMPGQHWALALSGYDWLQFLAERWWPIQLLDKPVVLGNGVPVSTSSSTDGIEVIAWLDPSKLPDEKISILREDKWLPSPADQLTPNDSVLAWHGPIPLFAITSFSVRSDERKSHLIALANTFSNIEPPPISFDISPFDFVTVQHPLPSLIKRMMPPAHWNSLRGAAAMALWSVPAISPWLDAVCHFLSKPEKPSRSRKLPDLDISWLYDTPWRYLELKRDSETGETSVLLWRAMLDVFSKINIRKGWRPQLILDQICDNAMQKGALAGSLDELLLDTSELLDDRKIVNASRQLHDPVGLTLQLLLLRPDPERFMSWRSDLRLSPAVIWMGAILSGLITGYSNLERRFKGDSARQRILDLIIWSLSFDKPVKWPGTPTPKLEWVLHGNNAQIVCDGHILIERSLGQRGQWYEADLSNSIIEEQAIVIAQNHAPHLLGQHITITDTRLNLKGSGKVSINAANKQLIIRDEISFSLPSSATVKIKLDHDLFRKWISTSDLKQRLPALPSSTSTLADPGHEPSSNQIIPAGLTITGDFISASEERELLKVIDSNDWSNELKRRVQHYGWKYNYKSRSISLSDRIGELPKWAATLAQRLHDQGLVPELPDQLIVNEYLTNQGISKHIDCVDCFKGPIVTISLIESWNMLFRCKLQKAEILLSRRSAVVLDGDARYKWTHEIAARKLENGSIRTRRISLTFRKVQPSTI